MALNGGAWPGRVAPGPLSPGIMATMPGLFPRGHIHRKQRNMKSPMAAIKEPIEQANMASLIALGIALIALGLAFAAMSKASNGKPVAVLWLLVRLI